MCVGVVNDGWECRALLGHGRAGVGMTMDRCGVPSARSGTSRDVLVALVACGDFGDSASRPRTWLTLPPGA